MKKDRKRLNLIPWLHRLLVMITATILVVWGINRYIYNRPDSNFLDIIFIASIAICITVFVINSTKASMTDGQTGMGNDDAMITFATIQFVRKRLHKYTVAFINLKNYKLVNKIAGSIGGDKGLEEYAHILMNFVERGEKVARLGGDNFIVLVKNERLQNLLQLISEVDLTVTVEGEKYEFKIYSRCGLYALKPDDEVGRVFNCSTIALNYAKASHQDLVWYDDNMAENMYHEKEISSKFREALNNKEFKVFYQPKVNVETNKLQGCEALVRWIRNGTIINPGDFIPALENNGSIKELDHYVFDQVCQDIVSWKNKGYDCVRVSSNFSKLNLKDDNFPQKILNTISKYSVDKELIEIELTESANYGDYSKLLNLLGRMKENGITTSIDDFGVGFSSLELLKNHNVDVVKIDKKFIDDIEENKGNNEHTTLVKHILNTCKELNKEVICEGVESHLQRTLLKDMNCDLIQGYLYDKPLTYEEFEKRLLKPQYDK